MIHWQAYYNQNKTLPMAKIREGYNRLLNEFNESRANIMSNMVAGQGHGGDPFIACLPKTVLVNGSSLSSIQTVEPTTFTALSFGTGVTSISGFNAYRNVRTIALYSSSVTTLSSSGLHFLTKLTTLSASNNTALTSLNISSHSLLSYLDVTNDTALTSLTVNNTSLTSADWRTLSGLTSLTANSNPVLTSFTVSGSSTSLATITANNNVSMSSVVFSGSMTGLTSLSINNSAFATFTSSVLTPNLTTLSVASCSALISFNGTASNNNLTTLHIENNPLMTSASITGFTSASSIYAGGSTQLASLSLTGLNKIRYLDVSNSALSLGTINTVLATLSASNLTSGSLYLQGGTNAIPTGTGSTAKTFLTATNGWTVQTN